MNTQEAKFILQAFRPSGEDANDPQFAEALLQLKNDPELSKWFAEQQAFDSAMSRALQQVSPPNDLRQNILAGGRVIAPAFWSRGAVWWAMAASFVLLLGLGAFWLNSTRFGSYVEKMAAASANNGEHIDAKISDFGQIQRWFNDRGMDTNFALPVSLNGVPATGCRILDWRGHKISMLCYMLDGLRHYDLFVAEKSDFIFPPASRLSFAKVDDLSAAIWTKADKVYLMVGHGDDVLFRKDLEAEPTAQKIIEAELSRRFGAVPQTTKARLFMSCRSYSPFARISGNKIFTRIELWAEQVEI